MRERSIRSVFLLLIVWLFLMSPISAAELDQFTSLNTPINDSLTEVNRLSNVALQQAVNQLNATTHLCNEASLYRELRNYFNNGFRSQLIRDIRYSDEIDRSYVKKRHSIYRHVTPFHGLALGLVGLNSMPVVVSSEINLNGYRIGIDKLEHLFERGYVYFRKAYLRDDPGALMKVLAKSNRGEELMWGGNIFQAGMKSYGDLAANFNGIRFWNDFLGLREDALGRNLLPVLVCHQQKWEIQRLLDLSDYVDDGFDETINCTKYASRYVAKKVAENILSLGEQRGSEYQCPLSIDRYRMLVSKYHQFAPLIINTVSVQTERLEIARIENYLF